MNLDSIVLKLGSHDKREDGVCAMEAVAWLAGEEHSYRPQCTCPVIGGVVVGWNDSITDDETRTRLLRSILPKLIGTRVASDVVLLRRMYLAVDWQIRTYAPAFLRVGGFVAEAEALEGLPEIVDQASLDAARAPAEAATNAAWNAAKNAATNAAYNAAYNAAKNAATNAAYNAAYNAAVNAATNAATNAAYNAATNAAWNAATNAATNAADNAAYNALAPTVAELQASAVDLILRMCAAADEVKS